MLIDVQSQVEANCPQESINAHFANNPYITIRGWNITNG